MLIQSKVLNGVSLTAHPKGCSLFVEEQLIRLKTKAPSLNKEGAWPKKALIIGSSMGYGLSSRLVLAFGLKTKTLGVSFVRPSDKAKNRTASPDYYCDEAFQKLAKKENLYHKTIRGDAFTNKTKEEVAQLIRQDMGKVDLIIYSLAAPMRTDPFTGEIYRSVLKPIDEVFKSKTVDPIHETFKQEIIVEPASDKEIYNTIKVMGGEDWELWMNFLKKEDLLEESCLTLAYSYVGPKQTQAIYRKGTIGRAKENLEQTAKNITETLKSINGRALISVNKALVTRASSVIPVLPLYLGVLYRVMKEKHLHEDCLDQMFRLFYQKISSKKSIELDETKQIRLDDWELREDVQTEVAQIWKQVNADNFQELLDLKGMQKDFLNLHGFGFTSIDYTQDVQDF